MRIITKFKDYYDSAVAFGLDPNVVYVRETKEVGDIRHKQYIFHVGMDYWYCYGTVGFCGKFYPFIDVRAFRLESSNKERLIFWDYESFDKWHKNTMPKRRRWSNYKSIFELPHGDIELFYKHSTPVYCKINNGSILINPKLKDLEFYRIFDAYHAHQEIAMFVGGVLNQRENMTAEISDEDRIAKHGYDERSFRRLKGEGPKRKRK